jgi:hypothetical protein
MSSIPVGTSPVESGLPPWRVRAAPRVQTPRPAALFPAGLGQRTGIDWWKRKKPAGSYRALTRTSRW